MSNESVSGPLYQPDLIDMSTKAYFILRKDLNMPAAKLAVQVGHGVDMIHIEHGLQDEQVYTNWCQGDRKKIVCKIDSEEALRTLVDKMLTNNGETGLRFRYIYDSGYTFFDGATLTGIVIFPMFQEHIPKCVRRLRLYE